MSVWYQLHLVGKPCAWSRFPDFALLSCTSSPLDSQFSWSLLCGGGADAVGFTPLLHGVAPLLIALAISRVSAIRWVAAVPSVAVNAQIVCNSFPHRWQIMIGKNIRKYGRTRALGKNELFGYLIALFA